MRRPGRTDMSVPPQLRKRSVHQLRALRRRADVRRTEGLDRSVPSGPGSQAEAASRRRAFVWRDPKLTGNEYFEETLEKRLLKTALLLSVVSPRYVKSESCLKEIEAFCRGAAQSGGIRFQDKARLLKVVKTEVPRGDAVAAAAAPGLRVLRAGSGRSGRENSGCRRRPATSRTRPASTCSRTSPTTSS